MIGRGNVNPHLDRQHHLLKVRRDEPHEIGILVSHLVLRLSLTETCLMSFPHSPI